MSDMRSNCFSFVLITFRYPNFQNFIYLLNPAALLLTVGVDVNKP